jgi:RNA 2',3'-cyclic 3'-phosphodiesterase
MSSGPKARLFVAVDPPATVREQLGAWARGAAAALTGHLGRGAAPTLRVLEPHTLHLTLCFLGGRPVGEIDAIGAALSACSGEVGKLSVGAPVWLPPGRPRALAVEIHDSGEGLAHLHRAVSEEIARATGWEAERRRFRAHVTVARMRGGATSRRRSAPGWPALPATPPATFTPRSLTLYRSWLSPAGASYEAIATCGLDPPDR